MASKPQQAHRIDLAALHREVTQEPEYRLWVNEARTVLVRQWQSGNVEVALRETAAHTWGPPIQVDEEKV